SMQLIAGRTAQEYNQRKHRKGAYWEDRYHATAVDTEDYLARCIAYIDFNMVRAVVVSHPSEWRWSGYRERQTPGQRYTVINNAALLELFNIHSFKQFQTSHRAWIEAALETTSHARDPFFSQCLAFVLIGFVENVQTALGINANHRNIRD
nr:hypothetical protein [Gammaproteobacteria bacterium]